MVTGGIAAFVSRGVVKFREQRSRFGTGPALELVLHKLLNSVMMCEWMHIIVLDRDRMRPIDPALAARFTSRLATLADLEVMQADPRLNVRAASIERLRAGDDCLLSCVDGKIAGYTWAHTRGRPELIPGLTISVPAQYLYNFAGLTLPEFRGLGLQGYRHRELLDSGLLQDRQGLLGFVLHTNFASRRGQAKSGYRTIGSVWLLGSRRHFVAVFSRQLCRLGISRL